ncbi:hypothetical protein PHSY_000459 [Pseudozyma hubeiensis SY62]|uniref:Uncharacterized protein n=1 Tax=Pseudozyma hubeiensis (strain SY62) TaxID=1305764 RepID=R9P498_PSEHS|nr:hypothetical protein PHSY_000459 [Pseudozyma hubeiensis SY62]GAC92900.1 hypothetical protein PHSY_000459 [Pseudozyma hubeiensis SY62]
MFERLGKVVGRAMHRRQAMPDAALRTRLRCSRLCRASRMSYPFRRTELTGLGNAEIHKKAASQSTVVTVTEKAVVIALQAALTRPSLVGNAESAILRLQLCGAHTALREEAAQGLLTHQCDTPERSTAKLKLPPFRATLWLTISYAVIIITASPPPPSPLHHSHCHHHRQHRHHCRRSVSDYRLTNYTHGVAVDSVSLETLSTLSKFNPATRWESLRLELRPHCSSILSAHRRYCILAWTQRRTSGAKPTIHRPRQALSLELPPTRAKRFDDFVLRRQYQTVARNICSEDC